LSWTVDDDCPVDVVLAALRAEFDVYGVGITDNYET
jgi:hypothetical protein